MTPVVCVVGLDIQTSDGTAAMTDFTSANRAGFLAIYLNDHLLGATAGAELARRLANAHNDTEHFAELARLADEIAEDRVSLMRIMSRLDVTANPMRTVLGWLGEKLARLKTNGRLLSRSPLSSLLELEMMALGVAGKAAGWRSLRAMAEHDNRISPVEIDRLIKRADAQRELLEGLRVGAAYRVLPTGPDQDTTR
jgi:hypothetical protein